MFKSPLTQRGTPFAAIMCVLLAAGLPWIEPVARGALLYQHDFTTLDDLTAVGGAGLQIETAPGGKVGHALRIMNPANASSSGATLTPSVNLPDAATFVFRVYIASHTGFQAVYTYPPGEGLRFVTGGLLQGSCGEGFGVSWQPNTWYTVALVVPASGLHSIYIRPGADAQLTEADNLGAVCAGNSTRPLTHSHFFNYGGDLYVADYTVNAGADLSICTSDDSFETGLDGWTGGANSGEAWVSHGGVCLGGYHEASQTGSYPAHEPWLDPDRSTFTADLTARFGPVIEYTYHVKDLSTASPGEGLLAHAFIYQAQDVALTRWQRRLLDHYPTEWTRVSFVVDTSWTDVEAAAAGWKRTVGNSSWAAMFAVNGVSGTATGLRAIFGTSDGSDPGARTTGLDHVKIGTGQLPQRMGTYCIPFSITSPLPYHHVPMDPSISFGQLIQEAGIAGVLDQNSIRVRDVVAGDYIAHAVERFGSEDTLTLEWVVEDPSHTDYEIYFTTVSERPAILPADFTPMIGVGDLLRYNAGEPRLIAPVFPSGLFDVTGDGKPDLVGVWNYGHRPGDLWDGIVVFPRVGSLNEFIFGDMFRIYEVPDVRYSHGNMGDMDGDGRPDIVFAPSSTTQMTVYRATASRHANQVPFYGTATTFSRPSGSGWLVSVVDLDRDGVLDVVAGAGFPNAETGAISNTAFLRNVNPAGWPPACENAGTLNVAGVVPAFFDVDGDSLLDAVSLVVDPSGPGLSWYHVAWQRNLGGSPPSFGAAELLPEINSRVWRPIHLAAVNEGPQRGLLVEDRNWQRVVLFTSRAGQGQPYFEEFGEARSVSAALTLSDQASPYAADWDGNGAWDLVVGGGYGWPELVINQGTANLPSFADAALIESEGEPIHFVRNLILGEPYLWHDMGYPWPVYEDWDFDGLPDLVVANETNRIFWYRNVGARQNPEFGPRQQVLVDGYPDSPALRQLSAQRALTAVYPTEVEQPFFWRSRASVVDLNGDGLPDLVAPNGANGHVALYERYRDDLSQLGLRKYRDDPRLRTVSGSAISGQAFCADWDGDGLLDLIQSRGGTQPAGSIFLLRNVGTRTDPLFSDPQPLYCFGQPIWLTWHGPHPAIADFNGDHKPDLLCYTEWSVYAFYSHVAIDMPARPSHKIDAPRAVSASPDFDLDLDVDQEDFGHLQRCLTGPYLGPPAAGCESADLDTDGDVDAADIAVLLRCVSGANSPADPQCDP